MKFSTSINIVRDNGKDFNYVVTANAKKAISKIVDSFAYGVHSFCLIGSYGTGKSSFILALENCLSGNASEGGLIRNNGQFNAFGKFEFLNIVGEYASLKDLLVQALTGRECADRNVFELLDEYYAGVQRDSKFLFVVVDEFGKVLEHAAKNNPEQEMYFLQQFCEYANEEKKNIIFLTTQHQGFAAYSSRLSDSQRQEWTKVRGRIVDVVFQEPAEQLLDILAKKLSSLKQTYSPVSLEKLYALAVDSKFIDSELSAGIAESLYPLDVFSAVVLILANQQYGQNERSLFSFYESLSKSWTAENRAENQIYNLEQVYDYIRYNFQSALLEPNKDSLKWAAIEVAVERVEGLNLNLGDIQSAISIVKVIGLLNIYASQSMQLDSKVLGEYVERAIGIDNAGEVIRLLESAKIIRFAKYKNKFILFDGTDVDIEVGMSQAAIECRRPVDYIDKIRKYAEFRCLIDNAHYYRTGTPRYYEYVISSAPVATYSSESVDGCINLVIAPDETYDNVVQECKSTQEFPIAYCLYHSSNEIANHIYELDKLQWVKDFYINDENDKVAIREVDNLIGYEREALLRAIVDGQFSSRSQWFFDGKEIDHINSRKELSRLLTRISDTIYPKTVVFKNELVNKSKVSGTVSSARLEYLIHLMDQYALEGLGFEKDKFPPEKALYLTILKESGICREENGTNVFAAPSEETFSGLWSECQLFIDSCRDKRRPVSQLIDTLSIPPYGLKAGFVDCWVPTFMLINREEYMLYYHDQFVPSITKEVLELLVRSPRSFSIKAFSVDGIRQTYFDRYRDLMNKDVRRVASSAFIETIGPFYSFYRNLNEYTKNTKDLPTRARKLRDVIAKTEDPEDAFFVQIPKALGYGEVSDSFNQASLEDFVAVLKDSIRELRNCYDSLISDIENTILTSLGIKESAYNKYKPLVDVRYKNVRQELMPADLKAFHNRLSGNYENCRQWIEALCYLILKKPLSSINDSQKPYLRSTLLDNLSQLDDYVEMHKESDESVVRVHITRNKKSPLIKQVILPKNKLKESEELEAKIRLLLSDDEAVNMSVLLKLLGGGSDGK